MLYDRITADPQLAGWFDGVDLRGLRRHQMLFLTAALGGPDEYGGRSLAEAHRGLGITNEAFDTLVGHLSEALRGIGIEDESRAAIIDRVSSRRAEVVDGVEP